MITRTRTRDEGQLELYAREAPAFMAGHAATFLARFGACEVKEGTGVEGVAIIEFPTFAEAKRMMLRTRASMGAPAGGKTMPGC